MSCAVMLQTQISAILDVLVKAAVAEISQLLEDDAAALHDEIQKRNDEIQKRNDEIQKRNDEIQGLKARLILTETQLQRLTADRCSVAVQVEIMEDTSVTVHSQKPQADRYEREKTATTSPEKNFSEEKPRLSHITGKEEEMMSSEELRAPPEDEDLSGLEFEMKIEQVEELVDRKLNEIQAEPSSDGQNHSEHHLWPSGGRLESHMESEHRSQSFTDSFVSMEDQMSSGFFGSGGMLDNESFSTLGNKDIECSLNVLTRQDSHRRSPTLPTTGQMDSDALSRFSSTHSSSCLPKTFTHSVYVEDHPRSHARPKPFRCEECGKGFTQKTRLITHRRVHTGEKPFRCQLCGKTFSRQDNCLRHVRLHNAQR
ncbi:zinc finger protein 182 [Triplophysa rosa]|uniref:Zinc finger protein 805 n=1 Tax=Triplophysa rosa TaxID=992332 RepID=A0A9W7WX74_TRIRA|nr:zinc finger protein 182 [Triplophysa rosa]KAI7809976.1 putative zinc finger protein 805 [Triplophysa rosa]